MSRFDYNCVTASVSGLKAGPSALSLVTRANVYAKRIFSGSALYFQSVDVRQIGRELGVRYVLKEVCARR